MRKLLDGLGPNDDIPDFRREIQFLCGPSVLLEMVRNDLLRVLKIRRSASALNFGIKVSWHHSEEQGQTNIPISKFPVPYDDEPVIGCIDLRKHYLNLGVGKEW